MASSLSALSPACVREGEGGVRERGENIGEDREGEILRVKGRVKEMLKSEGKRLGRKRRGKLESEGRILRVKGRRKGKVGE